jgi:hypothetical protein
MTRRQTSLRSVFGPVAAAITVAAVLFALGAAAWLAGALPGGEDTPTEAQTPGAPLLVFAEYSETVDRIYTAPAGAPGERTLLDTIPHAAGWAITPGAAIVDGLAAFNVLPPESAGRRDSPAELWILDVAAGSRVRFASDADLLIPPVFSPDGDSLLYRTALLEGRQEIVRVNLETRARRVVHVEESPFGVFPVGFDGSDRPLVVRLSLTGSDLLRIDHPEPPVLLQHLSDEITREWRLSIDGSALAFAAPVIDRELVLWQPRALRTSSGEPLSVVLPPASYYAPLWEPSTGALTAGSLGGGLLGGAADGVVLLGPDGALAALARPSEGFDVPLGWSHDGRWLAVRQFERANNVDPGVDTVTVIGLDGTRRLVEAEREVIVLGWTGA